MFANWNIALGVTSSLNNFIQEEDDVFYDFTIVVEEQQFKCHKLLLGACSLFFRGLFRSGMKETKSNSVCLREISIETFKLIRDVIYSSADVITKENLFDIWHAANQLQIQFLVEECERFAVRVISLENHDEVLKHATLLDSKSVMSGITNFIITNYKVCKDMETVLKLNGEEFVKVIKSDRLNTDTEESVIDVIIKWMDYSCKTPRKRNKITTSRIDSNMVDCMETTPIHPNELNDYCSNEDINSAEAETLETEETETNITEVHKDDLKQNSENWEQKDGVDLKSMDENPLKFNSLGEKNNSLEEETEDVIKAEHDADSLPKIDLKENIMADGKEICLDVVNPISEKKEMINPRAKYVEDILAAARLSLVSEDSLTRLFKHQLVADNKTARDIVFHATLYRNRGSVSTEWPPSTIPRNNYANEIIALLPMTDGSIKAYSFQRNKLTSLPQCEELKYCFNLTVARGQIYAAGYIALYSDAFNVFLLSRKKWLKIYQNSYFGEQHTMHVVSHSNFLYMTLHRNRSLVRLDLLKTNDFEIISNVPTNVPIMYVISYKHKIIVFCSMTGDRDIFAHCYDTISNKWTASFFEGLSQNMTSFEKNNETYLLMSDGDVYLVKQNEHDAVYFMFITKIWNEVIKLFGAINYNDSLQILSAKSTTVLASAETLFKNVSFLVFGTGFLYTRCLCVPKSLLES